jgi:hypothetical protein
MRRVATTAVVMLACASMVLAAGVKKYGKDLTLKETTKVSAIYASPESFNGKRVKVQGPIVAVCEMKGCWIELGSDKEFQTIRFKVEDGVIVFPMTAKGLTATVEGVVTVETLSVEEQIARAKEMEKEMGQGTGQGMGHEMGKEMGKDVKKPFDPKSVKGPKTVIMIKGEAAEVQDAAGR